MAHLCPGAAFQRTHDLDHRQHGTLEHYARGGPLPGGSCKCSRSLPNHEWPSPDDWQLEEARDGSFGTDLRKNDLVPDDSDDALIARLRAVQKRPVEKDPEPPHEKDDDPWDVVLAETGSFSLAVLAIPLRLIRWVRDKRRKQGS